MSSFKIKIVKSDIDRNVKVIVDTIMTALYEENDTLPFLKRVLKVFPELENRVYKGLTYDEIWEIVSECIKSRYEKEDAVIQKKIEYFQILADDKLTPVVHKLLDIFKIEYEKELMFTCYLGLYNPFPRNVILKECCIHYDVSDEVFLRSFIHEMDHMILFDKWKEMYGYEEENEPTYPDVLWYLEELIIEPTLNDARIQNIIPIKHEAYASFKNIYINKKSLTEQIQDFYDKSDTIEIFLNDTYRYIETYKHRF